MGVYLHMDKFITHTVVDTRYYVDHLYSRLQKNTKSSKMDKITVIKLGQA